MGSWTAAQIPVWFVVAGACVIDVPDGPRVMDESSAISGLIGDETKTTVDPRRLPSMVLRQYVRLALTHALTLAATAVDRQLAGEWPSRPLDVYVSQVRVHCSRGTGDVDLAVSAAISPT